MNRNQVNEKSNTHTHITESILINVSALLQAIH